MSWFWIAVAVIVPTALALVVAVPLWLKFDPIIGNALGAGILIGLAEACAVFALSVVVEERIRRRSFSPEWR